jgi:hypothetical protein
VSTHAGILCLVQPKTATQPELWRGIYLHCDGYPSHCGKMLLENYTTHETVWELLDLGDLEYLGRSPEFGPPTNAMGTKAFIRDGGEPDNEGHWATPPLPIDECIAKIGGEWFYAFNPKHAGLASNGHGWTFKAHGEGGWQWLERGKLTP